MRKGVLIIATLLTAFTLVAVGYQKKSEKLVSSSTKEVSSAISFDDSFVSFINSNTIPDIVFNVDTRFMHKMSKQDIQSIKQIKDLFPKDATENVISIEETRLTIVRATGETPVWGSGPDLSEEQRELLRSLDYSADYFVEAYCTMNNLVSKKIVYFTTVVPVNQATYEDGMDGLNSYLREEAAIAISSVKQEGLRAGRISFVIGKNGEITDLEKTSSSGYEQLDEQMLETMQNLPKKWTPARNKNGETVEQSLVLFFGLQGC